MDGEAVEALKLDLAAWLRYNERNPAPDLSKGELVDINIEVPIKGATFRGAKLRNVTFTRGLTGCDFSESELENVVFDAFAESCSFRSAALKRARFKGALSNADFSEANLEDCRFEGVSASRLIFRKARLTGCQAQELRATGDDPQSPNLDFSEASLSNVALPRSQLQCACFRAAALEGVDFQESSLYQATFSESRLHHCRLDRVQAISAKFHLATLGGIDAEAADFQEADFGVSRMQQCKLERSNFVKAKFLSATLRNVDLQDAYLREADLRNATLHDVDLRGATVEKVRMTRQDVEDIRNKDYCGLRKSQLHGMEIEDNLARMRRFFGGFWAVYHAAATLLWLLPVAWLIGRSLLLSLFPDITSGPGFARIPLWRQVAGYAWSGLQHPVGGPDPSYPLSLPFLLAFGFMLVYNSARLALVIDVRIQEHSMTVTGLYPVVSIGPWRSIFLAVAKSTWAVYGLIALWHMVEFMRHPYPALLR